MNESCDVVIAGAGAAGLSAAWYLRQAGLHVRVLEARERTGGRILTHTDVRAGVPVELGAEFVHGAATTTRSLLDRHRLVHYDADGQQWRAQNGRLVRAEKFFDRMHRVMRLLQAVDTDIPFATFLEGKPGGPRLARDRTQVDRFIQSFHGADPHVISARSLAQQGDPARDETIERTARVIAGYGALMDCLTADVREHVSLGYVVRRIEWEPGAVRVTAATAGGGVRIDARAVIVALPIGVLQARGDAAGAVTFDPDPAALRRAIDLMEPGVVLRVPLLFRERFWEGTGVAGLPRHGTLDHMMYMHTPRGRFTTWWTQYPLRAPLLVAWTGGPAARDLLEMGQEGIVRVALEELAAGTGIDPRRIRNQFVDGWAYDWVADPFTRGAYAYARVGGARAPQALARPVDDTIFMAGEAVASKVANGTVEGALAAGEQAARQVVARIRP